MEKKHDENKEKSHHEAHEHHHADKKEISKKIKIKLPNLESKKIINLLVILLSLTLLINLFLTFSISSNAKAKIQQLKEEAKPAIIQLVTIKDSKCSTCFDITEEISGIKSKNVNITKEENLNLNSNKAKELIAKYKIEKIPAFLVFGDIQKLNTVLKKEKDALVFEAAAAPYTNAASSKIIGEVSLIMITDASCKKCSDLASFIGQLKGIGVLIKNEKTIERNEASSLISKYKIEKIPSIILSKDLSAYTDVAESWFQLGTVEEDGSYVLREISPPYLDINKSKVVGLVDITYLTDKSCKECYDIDKHKQILTSPKGFNINANSEKTLDISEEEGSKLVKKYNITGVPTVILSSEISSYQFAKGLQQFFTVKEDGSYIFTNFQAMGSAVYKDLKEGKTVSVTPPTQG